MIAIVHCGVGNVGSVRNMFERLGAEARLVQAAEEMRGATKIVLPGVGRFDEGMRSLERSGLRAELEEMVLGQRVPTLGICLGMQLLTKGSEEGDLAGLGWIDAETVRFRFDPGSGDPRLPHMGWNRVKRAKEHSLVASVFRMEDLRYYFAHSYHVQCDHADDVLTTTTYGYDFPSAVQKENLFGVQFHPEKSHRFGMELLRNFHRMGTC